MSTHALRFLLLCSVSVCSVYCDLRLPPCLCERSSVLSVSFGVRKPAGTRTSVEALQTVTSKSDQVVNCRWSTGVGRLGPRHDSRLLHSLTRALDEQDDRMRSGGTERHSRSSQDTETITSQTGSVTTFTCCNKEHQSQCTCVLYTSADLTDL